jgi:hypothetical protein
VVTIVLGSGCRGGGDEGSDRDMDVSVKRNKEISGKFLDIML